MKTKQPKFKVGQLVAYTQGTKCELGIIKKVVPQSYTCKVIGSDPLQTYEDYNYSYFVWYHTGDTAALTDENMLYEISNEYAFLIHRRTVDT